MSRLERVAKKGGSKKQRAAVMPPGQPGHVTNPVTWDGWPWADGWIPQWDPQHEIWGKLAIVDQCVDLVARSLASMPLTISRDSEPQMPRTWLRNPDPVFYTHRGDAISEIVWSLLMRGNAWIAPTSIGADGYPLRWAVANPDLVEADVDGQGWVINSLAGLRTKWARWEPYAAGPALLHIRYGTRPGHRVGLSPLESVAVNIDAAAGYQAIASKIARKSGLPTQGILTTDQDIPKASAERYKDDWQNRGDGDVAVLGAGLKYQSLTLSPRDLALLELREFDGRAIAAAFGVPPFMVNLAAAGDLTYSTTQGMTDYFWRSTLRPLARNIGLALGAFLPGHSTVDFNADDYIRGTFADDLPAYAQAAAAGIMSTDEIRVARLNLSPRGSDPTTDTLAVATGV